MASCVLGDVSMQRLGGSCDFNFTDSTSIVRIGARHKLIQMKSRVITTRGHQMSASLFLLLRPIDILPSTFNGPLFDGELLIQVLFLLEASFS